MNEEADVELLSEYIRVTDVNISRIEHHNQQVKECWDRRGKPLESN